MAGKLIRRGTLGGRLLAGTALVGFAASSPAFAQTWTGGAGTSDWFTAGNWSPGIVPLSVLPVVINNGSTASPVVVGAAGAQSGGVKLGSTAGSVGALLVTGAGRLTDGGTYFIAGDHGEGAVTVSNGGQVATRHTVVANYPGTVGDALVTGAGSQWTATELTVSYDANKGTFEVADGGRLQIANPGGNAIVTLGRDSATADGTLTVTGAGSSFVIANGVYFHIGDPGRGVFNLLDGATADTSAIVNINDKSEAHVSGTGSSWTAQGGITNQGLLTVTDGGTLASNGRVTVGILGTATIADGGTLTATQVEISGTATIGSGGTVVSSGRVSVGSAGGGVLTVADGGALRLTDPTQGILIGSGTGTGGTLIVGAGEGQAAAAPGTVEASYVVFEGSANPGTRTLVFNHTANDYVFAPYITGGSGKGTVKVLAGTTTLAGGVASFDGTVDISGGAALKIARSAAPFSILPVDTKNDGTLFLDSEDFFTKATGDISGTGKVVKTGAGWLTLTGQNGWTGGTEIREGRLYVGELVGAEPQDGTLAGDVVNDGEMIFRRKTDYAFGGAISGSGSFEKEGAGTLTLTGRSTYAGSTTVWSGGMALGADDLLPSATTLRLYGGTFDLAGHTQTVGNLVGFASGVLAIGGGALTTVTSANATLASDITGTGDFVKRGAATLTLTGTKSFSGTTTVENGTLAVNGRLGGRLDVRTGGRLQGTGTVGDVAVAGTVAPGNSIGTLDVGDIAFDPGSIYEVEVDAAGQADLVRASGTATIDGGTVEVLAGAGAYQPQTDYLILTAAGGIAGVPGRFDGVTSDLAFLTPSLRYGAGDVWLTMTRNGTAFQNAGITPNQIAAGGGIESLGPGDPAYDAVLNLSAPQARYAFDRLSGEIHASARTAMLEDSRFLRDAVNDRIRAAFGGTGASPAPVLAYGPGETPALVSPGHAGAAFWSRAFGSWGRWDGDGNAAGLDRATGGFFLGVDAPVLDNWRVGAVTGYGHTGLNAGDRRSSASSDDFHVGLYGGATWGFAGGDLAFRSGAAYTWHSVSTSRNASFPGFGDSLGGSYAAGTAQAFGELAYGIRAGGFALEPFANLAYARLHTDGFTEKGNAAALTGGPADIEAAFATLGLRASTRVDLGEATATLRGMVGWRHAFGAAAPLATMRFASGGNAFAIAGVPIARDAAVIEAGLDFTLSPAATLGISYDGQFGSGAAAQSVRANFNMRF